MCNFHIRPNPNVSRSYLSQLRPKPNLAEAAFWATFGAEAEAELRSVSKINIYLYRHFQVRIFVTLGSADILYQNYAFSESLYEREQ